MQAKTTKPRQIVLDTETTGLESEQGHRVIEIGGVELIDRRLTKNNFHHYLQPDREIDAGAIKIHGITNAFLKAKPRFAEIAKEFIAFIRGAELIIHNASFDTAFLNAELRRLTTEAGEAALKIEDICSIVDTLAIARKAYPGQRNNLDALCKRYGIDQSKRTLHGALLDAELLADVYLIMTGGQVSLSLDANSNRDFHNAQSRKIQRLEPDRPTLRVVRASVEEETLHQTRLEGIDKKSGGQCLWRRLAS